MSTDTLSELIAKRLAIIERIVELSQKQLEVVRNGEISVLLGLLGLKQKFLGELGNIERELDPFRNEKPEDRVWTEESKRERCEATIKYCEELLAYVMELDALSEREISEKKDRTEERLKKLDQGTTVHNAYAKQHLREQAHFDLKNI